MESKKHWRYEKYWKKREEILAIVVKLKQCTIQDIMYEMKFPNYDQHNKRKIDKILKMLLDDKKIEVWYEGPHLRFIIPYGKKPLVRWTD